MKPITCPWCEAAPLKFSEVRRDAPNGAGSFTLAGVAMVCSAGTGCPDATGACATEAEAYTHAQEYGSPAWIGSPWGINGPGYVSDHDPNEDWGDEVIYDHPCA